MFERSGFISYANCGLPYYIGDVIDNIAHGLKQWHRNSVSFSAF